MTDSALGNCGSVCAETARLDDLRLLTLRSAIDTLMVSESDLTPEEVAVLAMDLVDRVTQGDGIEFPQWSHRECELKYLEASRECIALEKQLRELQLLAAAAGVDGGDTIIETFGLARTKVN